VIAARRDRIGFPERLWRDRAVQPRCLQVSVRELVTVDPRLGGMVVDDEDFVGKEQRQIPLRRIAVEFLLDRVELESDVVAERPVEREVVVVLRLEMIDDGAQCGKHAGRARPVLFRHNRLRFRNPDSQHALAQFEPGDMLRPGKRLLDHREDRPAALRQRRNRHVALVRGDQHWRIDDRRVPTRVAAGIFVVRRQENAWLAVQHVRIVGDRRSVVGLAPVSANGYTAFRCVGQVRLRAAWFIVLLGHCSLPRCCPGSKKPPRLTLLSAVLFLTRKRDRAPPVSGPTTTSSAR
jgi:hypothetical protein